MNEPQEPSLRARCVPGIAGVDFMPAGAVASTASALKSCPLGRLIHELTDLGFKDGENMAAAPYDWCVFTYLSVFLASDYCNHSQSPKRFC